MPTPRLPATHHNRTATKRAFQVNMKSAATAPIWNATIKNVVSLLIGSWNVRSFCKNFTGGSPLGFFRVCWLLILYYCLIPSLAA